jgi:hypothetical protein
MLATKFYHHTLPSQYVPVSAIIDKIMLYKAFIFVYRNYKHWHITVFNSVHKCIHAKLHLCTHTHIQLIN